jgi:hypothetical protein
MNILRTAFKQKPADLKTFLMSVQLIASDAAADEIRAAKDFAPCDGDDLQRPDPQVVEDFMHGADFSLPSSELCLTAMRAVAPNLKYIARDKAHGCQRTASTKHIWESMTQVGRPI